MTIRKETKKIGKHPDQTGCQACGKRVDYRKSLLAQIECWLGKYNYGKNID
jgi:hypothetical protein